MATPRCPEREELALLVAGRLGGLRLEQVAAHLDGCPACRATAAQLDAGAEPVLAGLGRDAAGAADTDRNLLFAVLALQADLIDRNRFVQVCTLWAARKDVPLAGQVFREVAIEIFGQNRLVRGDLLLGDKPVDLGRVTCPLLNVVARFDELVPPRACEPPIQVIGSRDTLTLDFPSSHIGIAAGIAAHEKLWPAVGQWLSQRDSHRRDGGEPRRPI